MSRDNFTSVYGVVKDDSDITSDNADNILIAWPILLNFIKQFGETEKGIRLLADYERNLLRLEETHGFYPLTVAST